MFNGERTRLKAERSGTNHITRSDIRTIIQDDKALESGIVPALEQYNIEQYTVAELSGSNEPVLSFTPCGGNVSNSSNAVPGPDLPSRSTERATRSLHCS